MATMSRLDLRRWLLPLTSLVLVAAACSSARSEATPLTTTTLPTTTTTAPPTTTTAPTTTTEPPVVLASGPSAGCDVPEPDRLPTSMTTADGTRRTFRIALPTSYDQTTPTPVVLDYHGLGSSGVQQALVSGVDFEADRAGYIAVIPDGAVNDILDTRLWNLSAGDTGALAGLAVDDVAFTAELLDLVESSLCIDTARVFSMGLSNGGFFSTVLACELSDRIAAVATVAGITHPASCDPVRPVPVLHFHGTADNVVPFDGGDSVLTGSGSGAFGDLDGDQLTDFAEELFQPIETEVDEWAEGNGCAADPEVVEVTPDVERRIFADCNGGDVEFYVVDGGGHTWPGSIVMAFIDSLGKTTLDVSATSLAFDWFDAHPMPVD